MLRSDMNLKITTGTVGYNNKILVSDEKFSLGKNDNVNSLETPAMKIHKVLAQTTNSNEVQAQKQLSLIKTRNLCRAGPLQSLKL